MTKLLGMGDMQGLFETIQESFLDQDAVMEAMM